MAEGLDLHGQAEAGGIDVAQQLHREGHILLERRLDLLDLGIGAHQVEQADGLGLGGIELLHRRAGAQEEPAGGAAEALADAGVELRQVLHSPGERQAGRTGGIRAGPGQRKAEFHARRRCHAGLVAVEAHRCAALLQLQHQRQGGRLAQAAGRNLDHGILRHLPVEQADVRHRAAETDEQRACDRPDAGQSVQLGGNPGAGLRPGQRMHGKPVRGDAAAAVEHRLAADEEGHGRVSSTAKVKASAKNSSSLRPQWLTRSRRAASIMAGAPQA